MLNKTVLVENLFLKPPEPTYGSTEMFEVWKARYSPSFHYITAAPQHLISYVSNFVKMYFPFGSISLLDIALLDLSVLTLGSDKQIREYKIKTVTEFILKLYGRRFVLIGDSTQEDPESYASVAEKYPNQVRCVFIRKVKGYAAIKELERNSARRFEAAFRNVDKERWFVFEEWSELANVDLSQFNATCRPNYLYE